MKIRAAPFFQGGKYRYWYIPALRLISWFYVEKPCYSTRWIYKSGEDPPDPSWHRDCRTLFAGV
jgi:hypothetical protein